VRDAIIFLYRVPRWNVRLCSLVVVRSTKLAGARRRYLTEK
jgi:hypothetical protein